MLLKSGDSIDATLEGMKSESVTFVQVVVDDIKVENPKFPLSEVMSIRLYQVKHIRSLEMLRLRFMLLKAKSPLRKARLTRIPSRLS